MKATITFIVLIIVLGGHLKAQKYQYILGIGIQLYATEKKEIKFKDSTQVKIKFDDNVVYTITLKDKVLIEGLGKVVICEMDQIRVVYFGETKVSIVLNKQKRKYVTEIVFTNPKYM